MRVLAHRGARPLACFGTFACIVRPRARGRAPVCSGRLGEARGGSGRLGMDRDGSGPSGWLGMAWDGTWSHVTVFQLLHRLFTGCNGCLRSPRLA
eukprot:760867-Prymnesium_polylepis.1